MANRQRLCLVWDPNDPLLTNVKNKIINRFEGIACGRGAYRPVVNLFLLKSPGHFSLMLITVQVHLAFPAINLKPFGRFTQSQICSFLMNEIFVLTAATHFIRNSGDEDYDK